MSRRHRVRTRTESRCSCAAHGGTAVRRPPVLRHVSAGGCRAGYRSAEDLPGQGSAALGGSSAPAADGGNSWCMCRLLCLILLSSSLLPSRSLTFQFQIALGMGGEEVFKVLLDRVQQPLHLTLVLLMALGKGFFALFPERKKCEARSALGVGTECGL